ncbi:MAG: NTP transferase domain-containing protein [Spirochaetaceae bacterium]|jgi:spore coat polysaccharide biosynthesis protein SpsF|nr:NTP transferase domain-containing protein [Spirochaetaceae bacterium]
MTAVILQARLDSSRLPQKALLPLGGRPLVFRVMEALAGLPADMRILACPEDCLAAFGPLADEAGFVLAAGPKEDVLERYCAAIRRFSVDRVIRATGDNPFVFIDAARRIGGEAAELDADYAAYAGLPYGAGVEVCAAEALLRAGREARESAAREHVCPYLYGHPERFTLHRPLAPAFWRGPSMRVTVDTGEDLARAASLYAALDNAAPGGRHHGAAIIAAYHAAVSGADRGGAA